MGLCAAISFRQESKLGPYEAALQMAGIEPLRIPPGRSPGGARGLLLTGGTDVDPALYGQDRQSETDEADRERDEHELVLLKQALEADMPILAICRGMQILNVALGGTLIQHLPQSTVNHDVRPQGEETGRHSVAHTISLESGSKLAEILGAAKHDVNSRHHQAVDRLGDGLLVTASAEDGVIEGAELPNKRFVIAVQWHPEDRVLSSPGDLRLFHAFAEAVQRG